MIGGQSLTSRLQRGQSQFAATQRSLQVIPVDPVDPFSAADHESRLRAAENLVATKRHNVGAGADSFRNDGFLRQSVSA